MDRPAFQFYPGDWRRDLALQSCSLRAKGLWIEMLCLMHDGDPGGHLAFNGLNLEERLPRMVGGDVDEVEQSLGELEAAGVFSRTEDGVIFSRRMAKDSHISKVRSKSGKKGAAAKHFAKAKPVANAVAKPQQTVADADADAETVAKEGAAKKKPAAVNGQAVRCSWDLLKAITTWKPDHRLASNDRTQDLNWVDKQAPHFDKLERLDKVSWDRIGKVLAWLPTDDFWPPNIQTGAKFRKQFDRLEAQSKKSSRSKPVQQDWSHLDRDNDDDWAVPDGLDK